MISYSELDVIIEIKCILYGFEWLVIYEATKYLLSIITKIIFICKVTRWAEEY